MNETLRQSVEAAITLETGAAGSIARDSACGGGCINDARVLELDDGRRFFLKTNPAPLPRMFEAEAAGLAALAEPGAIRVPRPIATGANPPFILMENIAPGRQERDFQERLGRGLARLHRVTAQARFGFDEDNYIGATPQPNGWMNGWTDFWRERRLGFQLKLARDHGRAGSDFFRAGERLMARLGEYLDEPAETACLLHGDLWGGNYLSDEAGEPVLIDPATYYGRREADLAMTYLFGGFDARFYAAYEEIWPLEEGSAARLDLYKLYHLLNHLNLFGGGYAGSCMAIMQRYG